MTEREAILLYLRKTRDVWRQRSRETPKNKLHEAMCVAKVAVLEGVIADIENEFHLAEAVQ